MTLRFGTADRPDVRAGTVAELLALSPGERAGEPLAWLRDGTGFVGWGQAWRLDPGAGPERFARAGAALAEAFAGWDGRGAAPVAMAAFTFDPAAHGSFVRVPELLVHSGAAARAVAAGAGPDARPDALAPLAATVLPERATADRVRYAGASLPDLLWLDAVAAATRLIDKGDIDKVVLARDHAVWSEAPFEPRVLAARLAARFPGCFTFVAEGLVGASPEMLVRRRGTRVESLVLAGSAARGDGAADDAARGDALLASAKDRAEHAFAVASVREALAPLCRTLESDAEPSLLRLDNVQHLATRFGGTLAEPAPSALALAGALHPTAAVCGTPTAEALEVIRELEGMERGRYTGPVGWVDARGDGEFAIALRCAELSGARARLFAGAGIVAASLPEAELEETRLKLRAMQSAFAD
ncbi:MAG TPA: isochorismate synthase [Egibacteraceae bacterium]|nr:isochorismate synthase [Egibacteraceae bacterium]